MKYTLLIISVLFFYSCETPQQQNSTINKDNIVILSKANKLIVDTAKNNNSEQSIFDTIGLALEKGKSDLYGHYIDIAKKRKTITEEDAKKYKQAITILKLSNYDKVYPVPNFFITEKNITDTTVLYGFYSLKGKEIVKPQFDDINPIHFAPLFLGTKNKQDVLINEFGKVVLSNHEINTPPDEEGFICIKNKQGKYGYFHLHKQKIVIETVFDTLGIFEETNKVIASKQGKRFYIDRTGKVTTPPNF